MMRQWFFLWFIQIKKITMFHWWLFQLTTCHVNCGLPPFIKYSIPCKPPFQTRLQITHFTMCFDINYSYTRTIFFFFLTLFWLICRFFTVVDVVFKAALSCLVFCFFFSWISMGVVAMTKTLIKSGLCRNWKCVIMSSSWNLLKLLSFTKLTCWFLVSTWSIPSPWLI